MPSAGQTAGSVITYVVPVERVREAITELLSRQAHPFFPAYMHLRQLAARHGRTTSLTPDWPALGALLEVTGGPPGKPYLRPFWRGARDAHQEWLNSNLAGSYAPSSLRSEPMRVVEIDARRRFNLRPGHAQLALENLLSHKRLPALAVAAFFLRDYGVVASQTSNPQVLIDVFKEQFGYLTPADDNDFQTLYDEEWGRKGRWLEIWDSP